MECANYRCANETDIFVVEEVDERQGVSLFFCMCRYLDPKDPKGAQRRIEAIYWDGWRVFVRGFFLSGVGVTFLALGAACALLAGDVPRGLALLTAGATLSLPGVYSLAVLWRYVRGEKEYSYTQLMED